MGGRRVRVKWKERVTCSDCGAHVYPGNLTRHRESAGCRAASDARAAREAGLVPMPDIGTRLTCIELGVPLTVHYASPYTEANDYRGRTKTVRSQSLRKVLHGPAWAVDLLELLRPMRLLKPGELHEEFKAIVRRGLVDDEDGAAARALARIIVMGVK
jgi:hypothetical protein